MVWAQFALTTARRSMKARWSAEPSSVRGISPGFHLRMAELFKGPHALPYPLTTAKLSTIKCKLKFGDSRRLQGGLDRIWSLRPRQSNTVAALGGDFDPQRPIYTPQPIRDMV